LLPYALPLLFLGLAGIVNETFDRAVFRKISGLPEDEATAQLGIYGACYKVAMLLSIGIQAYRFAAEPFIFSLAKGEQRDKVQALIMKYYFIVALFISLTLIAFMDVAIMLVGEAFREGEDVIPILLGAYVLYGAVFNLSFWYKLNDKTLYGALIAAAGALVTITLNFLLVPHIGYHGAAWATLGAYLTMTVFSFFLMKRHHPVSYDLKEIGQYLALAIALYVILHLFSPMGWLKYLVGTGIVAIYVATVIIKEKKFIQIAAK
jgi:O-antigen/teichoic acid export membrane protein